MQNDTSPYKEISTTLKQQQRPNTTSNAMSNPIRFILIEGRSVRIGKCFWTKSIARFKSYSHKNKQHDNPDDNKEQSGTNYPSK